ncbi:MAG TPA: hypothetical protein VNX25_03880 [Verrucomicrobiae bacterium]|nr:hypothetical protein [Verrucomicrobiae bacterium]
MVREEGASPPSISEALAAISPAPVLGLVYNHASAQTLTGRQYGYSYDYGEQPKARKKERGPRFSLFPFPRPRGVVEG